jgi:hypothetical protein
MLIQLKSQFMKILLTISFTLCAFLSFSQSIQEPVQAQLDAYNKRDIDAFLKPYSDSVLVYTFPDQLQYQGKELMRKRYVSLFENTPALHCNLLKRIVLKDTVIDHEEVTFSPTQPNLYAAAIYKVKDGLIQEVYFIY